MTPTFADAVPTRPHQHCRRPIPHDYAVGNLDLVQHPVDPMWITHCPRIPRTQYDGHSLLILTCCANASRLLAPILLDWKIRRLSFQRSPFSDLAKDVVLQYGRARLSLILLAQPLVTTHVSRHTTDLVGEPACFVEPDGSADTYDPGIVLLNNSHYGHSRLAQCDDASACNAGLLQPLLVPVVPRLNGIPSR